MNTILGRLRRQPDISPTLLHAVDQLEADLDAPRVVVIRPSELETLRDAALIQSRRHLADNEPGLAFSALDRYRVEYATSPQRQVGDCELAYEEQRLVCLRLAEELEPSPSGLAEQILAVLAAEQYRLGLWV